MEPKEESYCSYCGDRMDPGSEFVFLVESQSYIEQRAPSSQVQSLFPRDGKPLRICEECRASVEQNILDLEERAEKEMARSRRYRIALAIIGLVAVLIPMAFFIADRFR
jgi:hypothetical protein